MVYEDLDNLLLQALAGHLGQSYSITVTCGLEFHVELANAPQGLPGMLVAVSDREGVWALEAYQCACGWCKLAVVEMVNPFQPNAVELVEAFAEKWLRYDFNPSGNWYKRKMGALS